jgi:Antirepressor regulating drug resistance, predicted signal transduction N-terminal membrane component
MNGFIFTLLSISLTMSVVILLLLLFNKILANKVSAISRYYMWLIVLFGLLIPFRPRITTFFDPVPIPISFETAETIDSIEGESPQIASQEATTSTASAPTTLPIDKAKLPIATILLGIWITGVLIVLVFNLRIYTRFTVAVRRWGIPITDEQTNGIFQKVWNDMGFTGKPIALKECIFLSSPMLVGLRKPAILLPKQLMPLDELEYIFRHELTHYKRKDLLVNLMTLLTLSIHWFNPFVYLMVKAIQSECEVACDEAVVAGKDSNRRRRYGETIISFIGTKNAMTPALSTYFYGGKNSMKKRLIHIMDMTKKKKGLATICILAIIAVTILAGSIFVTANTAKNNRQHIGEEAAKSIALSHADLTEAQVTFIKVHLQRDDRRMIYDIEFYSDNIEYDYEIDAINGTILEFDSDIEDYSIPPQNTVTSQSTTNDNTQYIDETEAKAIALAHANLNESQVTFVKAHLEHDDRTMVYNIEFFSNNIEYDYEIDATSGTILEFDSDIEDYSIPPQDAATPPSTTNDNTQYIDETEAKAIALNHANLTESQVIFVKAHLEHDDRTMVYNVEFYSDNIEYDYEIDATNGTILEFDSDIEHYSIPNNSSNHNKAPHNDTSQHIGEAKAKSIALANAGLSESQVTLMVVRMDRENGVTVYEVEFNNGRTEYDYEIDAITGQILKRDTDLDD